MRHINPKYMMYIPTRMNIKWVCLMLLSMLLRDAFASPHSSLTALRGTRRHTLAHASATAW